MTRFKKSVIIIIEKRKRVLEREVVKMTKEERKNLLIERIKVITEKGKTKGQHNVITKLQRKLRTENF